MILLDDGSDVLSRRSSVNLLSKGTFSRTGVGSYRTVPVDGSASLLYAASDVPRLENRDDGALLLLERATTNLDPFGTVFGSWTPTGATITPNVDAGPDALSTADRIADVSVGAFEYVQQAITVTSGLRYVWSIFVKKDADQSRFPEFGWDEGASHRLQLNTATGATLVRLGSFDASYVQDWGTYWRVVLVKTTSTTSVSIFIIPAHGQTLGGADAAATGGITCALSQFELGTSPSSPIQTSGVTATRGADTLTVAAAPSWFFLKTASLKKFSPAFANSDLVSGNVRWLFTINGADDGLRVRHDGSSVLVEAVQGGAVRAASQALSFSRHAQVGTIKWAPSAGRVYVAGIAGPAGTPWAWTADPVRFGGIYGGSGSELDGRIPQRVAKA